MTVWERIVILWALAYILGQHIPAIEVSPRLNIVGIVNWLGLAITAIVISFRQR